MRNDIRYALRSLKNHPGFAVVAIVTLALGIGGTTSIFSVVEAVLLRPLPYAEPDRLVTFWTTDEATGADRGSVSYPDYSDWREQATRLDGAAAFRGWGATMTAADAPAEALDGGAVSAGFFSVLGVLPQVGRWFTEHDETPGHERVVVLSHAMWRERFGGAPDVSGRALRLDGEAYTVVGVLPPEFRFPPLADATVWRPLALNDERRDERGNQFLRVVARVGPAHTVASVQQELDVLAQRLAAAYPATNSGKGVRVVPLREDIVGEVETGLYVLLGAIAVVLVIACANVASLFLARALARRKEIALRAALGARRPRLMRQVLVESTVIALAAGVLGIGLAFWLVEVLVRLSPTDLPRADGVGVNLPVLLAAVAVSLGSGLAFGILPALQQSGAGSAALAGAGRHGDDRHVGRLRTALVLGQVVLAFVLTIGAGLLLESFAHLRAVDPGLRSEPVLTFDLSLPASRYGEKAEVRRFSRAVVARLEAVPGVTAAGAVTGLPFRQQNDIGLGFLIEGRPAPPPNQEPAAKTAIVMPGYFETLGIPLLRGRAIRPTDDEAAPPVVVINQTMAARYWPGEDPLGQRIALQGHTSGETPGPREIIGIVGDVRQYGLAVEPEREMYVPQLQFPLGFLTLTVRTAGPPEGVVASLRAAVGELDPDLPVANVRTMDTLVHETIARPRFYARRGALRGTRTGPRRTRDLRRAGVRRQAANARDRHPCRHWGRLAPRDDAGDAPGGRHRIARRGGRDSHGARRDACAGDAAVRYPADGPEDLRRHVGHRAGGGPARRLPPRAARRARRSDGGAAK